MLRVRAYCLACRLSDHGLEHEQELEQHCIGLSGAKPPGTRTAADNVCVCLCVFVCV